MKVLFIGNSHTYVNDMPALFAKRVRELTGSAPEITALMYSGRPLKWHWDEFYSVRFQLVYGGYDFCVIQQQGHPFPGEETTMEYGSKIISMCRENGVTPVVYMPWTEKDNLGNIGRVSGCYRRLCAETGAVLAPVGEVFDFINRNSPDIRLYSPTPGDDHASVTGDYLISLTIASAVTGGTAFSGVSDIALDYRKPDGSLISHAGEGFVALDPKTAKTIRDAVARGMKGELGFE